MICTAEGLGLGEKKACNGGGNIIFILIIHMFCYIFTVDVDFIEFLYFFLYLLVPCY